MKKKLVLKPAVLEFNFSDEGAIPASLVDSRQEGAPKRVRRQISVSEVVVFMAKVSPPVPTQAVLVPLVGLY